ncbi:Isochorismatase [Candidatus Desulfarcum epimagneticum]|uniref:Isochorismatase n=1 Tax=uncultured Desulfobacteraceae bacterium TaxID=218296 RepID=A0A484HGI9_9BACT|nr:Isochorismatase [uncultured Desulfobacteraceae bacterium]
MLEKDNLVFVIIDIQGKLARLMRDRDSLFQSVQTLIRGMDILKIPILRLEQIPEKLGPTIPEIDALLPAAPPIPKSTFSACGNEAFMAALKALNKSQVLLAGIETHICVYQTAADLVRLGYETEVSVDAVSSRTSLNKETGLEKIRGAGAALTTVETAFFELLKEAGGDAFKKIAALIK